jgi:hypothetical protein
MKAVLAWIIHGILPAWIAKLVVEAPTMSELPEAVQTALAPAAEMTVNDLQAALVPAPDNAAGGRAGSGTDYVALAATLVKVVDPAAAPAADAVLALDAMIPTGTISKLETILAALGHDLPPFWAEAVALAKKA